jgi:hypothetical protein
MVCARLVAGAIEFNHDNQVKLLGGFTIGGFFHQAVILADLPRGWSGVGQTAPIP